MVEGIYGERPRGEDMVNVHEEIARRPVWLNRGREREWQEMESLKAEVCEQL